MTEVGEDNVFSYRTSLTVPTPISVQSRFPSHLLKNLVLSRDANLEISGKFFKGKTLTGLQQIEP